MKLYIKQKVFSIRDKFTVEDEDGNDRYFVKGEFISLRGNLHIFNSVKEEIGEIYSKLISLTPHYILELDGEKAAEIVKEITLFKPNFKIKGTDIRIKGNIFDHDYDLYDGKEKIMEIRKKWVSIGDSYVLNILDEKYELLALGIALAIDMAIAEEEENEKEEEERKEEEKDD